jgi:CRISPR-associated protein Cas6/Cse3/CasE subtype I-E
MEAQVILMLNHTIPKPETVRGYAIHRMIAELCAGCGYQFVDRGDHLIVRTEKQITESGQAIRQVSLGEVLAFELRASVAIRKGGRNIYPEIGDWRTRRTWLEGQSAKLGFLVLAVHVNDGRLDIVTKTNRKFWIDATDFTGILKVTDHAQFEQTLSKGIGRVGKAFGMGMLNI